MAPAADRRQMLRHPQRLAVSYSILADSEDSPICYSRTHTTDISGSGMQAQTPKPIPPGSLIQLCIHLPNSPAPVLMVGKSRWTGSDADGKTGIQFIGNLPPQIEEQIVTR